MVGSRRRVKHRYAAEPAFRHGHRDGECQSHHRLEEKERDEAGHECQVESEIPPPEVEFPAPEVREVLVATVRKVQRDHPEQVDPRLGFVGERHAGGAQSERCHQDGQEAGPRQRQELVPGLPPERHAHRWEPYRPTTHISLLCSDRGVAPVERLWPFKSGAGRLLSKYSLSISSWNRYLQVCTDTRHPDAVQAPARWSRARCSWSASR